MEETKIVISGSEFLRIKKKARKVVEETLVDLEKNSPEVYARINCLRARNGMKKRNNNRIGQ